MTPRAWVRAAAGVLAVAALGCVTREHHELVEAREALARCVAEQSASHPDCEALKQRTLAAERRYDEGARRAWGCDPAQEECPTPR